MQLNKPYTIIASTFQMWRTNNSKVKYKDT